MKSFMEENCDYPGVSKDNARMNYRAMNIGAGVFCVLASLFSVSISWIATVLFIVPGIYCIWRAVYYYKRG